jgi:2'-5' RNA ligase
LHKQQTTKTNSKKQAPLAKRKMDLLELLGSSDSSDNDMHENRTKKKASQEKGKTHKKRKRGSVKIVLSNQVSPDVFVRAQPHQRGHWAGHVRVPFTSLSSETLQGALSKFRHRLERAGYSGVVVQHEHLHLSVSRPFSMQLAFIESFVQQLTERLRHERSTRLFIDTTGILLVNDDKTRSFFGWKVRPNLILERMLRHVDQVLGNYNQPPYYDPPTFHISIASVSGNISEQYRWEEEDRSDDSEDEEALFLPIEQIHCNFGTTKVHIIDLKPSS